MVVFGLEVWFVDGMEKRRWEGGRGEEGSL